MATRQTKKSKQTKTHPNVERLRALLGPSRELPASRTPKQAEKGPWERRRRALFELVTVIAVATTSILGTLAYEDGKHQATVADYQHLTLAACSQVRDIANSPPALEIATKAPDGSYLVVKDMYLRDFDARFAEIRTAFDSFIALSPPQSLVEARGVAVRAILAWEAGYNPIRANYVARVTDKEPMSKVAAITDPPNEPVLIAAINNSLTRIAGSACLALVGG